MNNNSKEYLKKLVDELCILDEDKNELSLWIDLFDGLIQEEQKALIANLEKELGDLKKLEL